MAKIDFTFKKQEIRSRAYPNYWDLIALLLVFAILFLLAFGAKEMTLPFDLGTPLQIDLNPEYLPYYALRSVIRMLIALALSLLFTFIVGTAAAKNKHAERLIIPLIDILQSVPVLGYLSIAVPAFIALFPQSMLGPECAAIFAVFTAQVWNITLSFYQSMMTIPKDLREASDVLQLSAWQRFWRLEVPFAMPGLLWNMMMSMSASWFFVVASEAVSIGNQNIVLPGIGAYIAIAVKQANLTAIGYAILAMFAVIILYDQLLFRPLNQWLSQFKTEANEDESESNSWLIHLFRRTHLLRSLSAMPSWLFENFVNLPRQKFKSTTITVAHTSHAKLQRVFLMVWYGLLIAGIILGLYLVSRTIFENVALKEFWHVIALGAATGARVLILIALSSLIWLPLGVWIGMRPRVAGYAQPIIQFLASFPVNLFYPIFVLLIVNHNLNVNIWCSPLMILGTQWYIAFNVIAGTLAMPKELRLAARNFQVKGWLWWKRLVIPGIFPYFLTGAITAAGGAWNASIIAEALYWGKTHLIAYGLGAYITEQTQLADFPKVTLGIMVMCLYVVGINRLIWKPLYRLASERFNAEG